MRIQTSTASISYTQSASRQPSSPAGRLAAPVSRRYRFMPAAYPWARSTERAAESERTFVRKSALAPKSSRSTKSEARLPRSGPKNSADRLVAETKARIATQKLSRA